jgi:hypothetical protein
LLDCAHDVGAHGGLNNAITMYQSVQTKQCAVKCVQPLRQLNIA